MSIALRSFAKINLGLKIGPRRPDGFHELRTVYQTLALHDVVRVEAQPGSGIEIRCDDPRVPLDESNTCYKMAEQVLKAVARGPLSVVSTRLGGPSRNEVGALRVVVEIEKRLPVQGGLGAASSNGVATMLGLERALGLHVPGDEKLRMAAGVGSDLPLFLIGGTVLGEGRGEEVQPLPEIPELHVVLVAPPIGVSTPRAFALWDELAVREPELTTAHGTGTIEAFGQSVLSWLNPSFYPQAGPASGVPAGGGNRAETPLLDLVRTGIENDFERVVFPEYPELYEVKRVLQREGAAYASLSGSGSTLFGLFESEREARGAAARMNAAGHSAVTTTTVTRERYWNDLFEC